DHLFQVVATPNGSRLGAEIPETDTAGSRVRDHKLTVRFEVPTKTVRISDRITVERTPESLPATILRLNAIYTVDSVRRNGLPIPFHQAGGFLAIAEDRL